MNEKTLLDATGSPIFEATMREEIGDAPTQREHVEKHSSVHNSLIRLPSPLDKRYSIINEMPAKGGEADIVLVQTDSGKNVIIKLYRPGIVPKPEILEYLHNANPSYVIQQLEYGESGGRWYEVMEFAPHGSLRDLLDNEGPRLDSDLVRAILVGLSKALGYLHNQTPRVIHRDLKPENILLRSRNPLEIVFTDFGISSMLEQSVRFTSANRSVRYAAPEAMAGAVSPASDWWGIGIMLVEMLSGRHPFAHLDERVVTNALYERRPIDLLGVAEADWQMLCKGLLNFDAKVRWGAAEVERWLAGDNTLSLPPEDASEPPVQGIRALRPYRIAGEDAWTLDDFLRGLACNWDEAIKRMARRTDMERWLLNDLQDQDAYNIFLDIVDVQDVDPQTQLTSLLMALMPGAIPEELDVSAAEPETLRVCLQATAGLAESQLQLGKLFLEGDVIQGDSEKAESWLGKSASQGNVDAQEHLQQFKSFRSIILKAEDGDLQSMIDVGDMYDNGIGTLIDKVKAVLYYRKAAEKGNLTAQYNLGRHYHDGSGVPKDYIQAVEWYKKAAENGHEGAQFHLGMCYTFGEGVEKDHAQAVEWYRKAAEYGEARAQCNLGWCYEIGNGVPQDHTQAAMWYTKSAMQGDDCAQCNLGWCYESGFGVPQDFVQAVAWYKKSAMQGYDQAQCNLGVCYESGIGVQKDETQAVEWYRKAAEQGHARAQIFLGLAYENAMSVAKDDIQAVEWYRKAAEQGNEEAQNYLGVCYDQGKGVSQDFDQALYWYKKSAEQGDTDGQNNLGVCYFHGKGVQKDYAQAAEWYIKAAEQGHAYAQSNLAWCYEYGQGVPQDYKQAVKWYELAAGQDVENASEKFVTLCTKLANDNDPDAQYKLAHMFDSGKYVNCNEPEALRWLQKAAERGSMLAQREMGIRYATGKGVTKSKRLARSWYKDAIAQGDSESMRLIEDVKGWF